ncbi:tyrosine-type recombinase/integrase [Klebsiella grimontii]|uniref:tyrosine-type recombinase/integrase n=1 Tax=Klebsiella grimontii TaxID=2058152 RepID=UPI000A84D7C3|nr:tyrosine-type recombinase/integrase [Klebsiella grimontii]MDU4226903.1 tyrosine-type recombinase/integrase [Klebsiella grimontii]MDU4310452.1 tyrosine-type recombinase/integrase [Klebsiella michiganensis]
MLVILPCGQGVSSYLALPASRTTYVHQFIILCCYKTKALFNHLFLIKNKSTKRLQPHGDKEKIMGNAMVALKTAEEVKAVSAELARNTKTNLFRCLWAMQFESALRFGDAVKLTWDQFAEGKTHLSIKQEKTGKLHKVAITPAMRSIVQARREEAADRPKFGEYIFSLSDLRSKGKPVSHNAVLTEYGKCGRRAGFLDVGSHTPRKSKGRILFENGAPLEHITKLLGQANPTSTLFYIGFTQETADTLSEEFSLGEEW